MKLKITLEKNDDFKTFIKEKIKSYNNNISHYHKISRAPNYIKYFNIEVKDKDFIAGLTARIYWDLMEIDDFYIEEPYRKKGLGSKMIKEAINYAEQMKLNYILLHTFSFQARDFYIKHGFEIVGEITDYPPGESLITLKKKIK